MIPHPATLYLLRMQYMIITQNARPLYNEEKPCSWRGHWLRLTAVHFDTVVQFMCCHIFKTKSFIYFDVVLAVAKGRGGEGGGEWREEQSRWGGERGGGSTAQGHILFFDRFYNKGVSSPEREMCVVTLRSRFENRTVTVEENML